MQRAFQLCLVGDVDHHHQETVHRAVVTDVGCVVDVHPARAGGQGEGCLEVDIAAGEHGVDVGLAARVVLFTQHLANRHARRVRALPDRQLLAGAVEEHRAFLAIVLGDHRRQLVGDALQMIAGERNFALRALLLAGVGGHQVPAGDGPVGVHVRHQISLDRAFRVADAGLPHRAVIRSAFLQRPAQIGQERGIAGMDFLDGAIRPGRLVAEPVAGGPVGEAVAAIPAHVGDQRRQVIGDRIEQGAAAVLRACQAAQQEEHQHAEGQAAERQCRNGQQAGNGDARGSRKQGQLPGAAEEIQVAGVVESRLHVGAVARAQIGAFEHQHRRGTGRADEQAQIERISAAGFARDFLHHLGPAESRRRKAAQVRAAQCRIGLQRHRGVVDRRIKQEAGTSGIAARTVGQGDPRGDAQLSAVTGPLHGRAPVRFGEHVLAQQRQHAVPFGVDQVEHHVFVARAVGMQTECRPVDFALAGQIGG